MFASLLGMCRKRSVPEEAFDDFYNRKQKLEVESYAIEFAAEKRQARLMADGTYPRVTVLPISGIVVKSGKLDETRTNTKYLDSINSGSARKSAKL